MSLRLTSFVTICCLCLGAVPCQASIQDLFGFGTRGPALAGSAVASTSGWESVYYNPAGLVVSTRTSVSVGYVYGLVSLKASGLSLTDPALMRRITNADPAQGLMIGASLLIPIKRGWFKERIGLGLGLVMPGKIVIRAYLPRPYEPQFPVVGNRGQIVGVQLAAALRIGWGLSVGAGVNALAGLFGSIDVGPNLLGNLGSQVEDNLLTDFSLIAGVMWRYKQWAIGVTYRGQSVAAFKLPITADLGNKFPIDIPTLAISGVAQFDPRQVGLSLAYRPIPALLLEANATWKEWHRYPTPIANTTAGNPPLPPPRFVDIVVPRLGIEYQFDWKNTYFLSLRGGYAFEKSPVRQQTGRNNFLDNDRHILALGAGFRYSKPKTIVVNVDWYLQYHHLVARRHVKDDDVLFAPSNQGFPSIASSGYLLAFGASVSLGF